MTEAPIATSLLSWQQPQFQRLQALHSNNRLAHAWLLAGQPGIGKLAFARHFARQLFCRKAASQGPCGACQDCLLFTSGNHPDWMLLQPELRTLKIDLVREAIVFAQNTSQRGGAKVIIINPAESMNQNAANALLKILEEPPAQTFLLLVSHQPGLLLPTLRSRCQRLDFPAPPQAEALAWLQQQPGANASAAFHLQLAQGAPLRALELMHAGAEQGFGLLLQNLEALVNGETTPVQAAKKCEDLGITTTINYQLLGVSGLLSVLQTGSELAVPALMPLLSRCNQVAGTGMIRRLHDYYQSLVKARETSMATNNANPQLMLEALFAEWCRVVAFNRARAN
jgi:DNA polymerase-3 subunit delta'